MTEETNAAAHDDELLDQFVQQLEQAADPSAFVQHCCKTHPQLAPECAALAEAHRLLARVRPDPEPPLPACLGDFRIVRKIAWGGMGDIYEAVQEPFGRRVAVKTIRPMHVSAAVRTRFLREQQVLAGLHQTHIVPIFAAGCVGATHYFAMPYLHGVTLQDVLRAARKAHPSGPKPTMGAAHGTPAYFQLVAALLADVAEAIAYTHQQGILHRDLKPGNLLLAENGHVWVLDFGLAGYVAEGCPQQLPSSAAGGPPGPASDLTSPGSIPGTLDYMAPEQLDGRADARTDVWGVGVVLYELLTLHRAYGNPSLSLTTEPITGDDARARRRQELAQPLAPPRDLVANLPRDLEAVCKRCLEIEPAARYPSAQALANDLRNVCREEETSARRWHAVERLGRWRRRHPARVEFMVLTVLLLAAAACAGYTWQLRAHNARNADKLAGSVAVQFEFVKRAVSISARQEKLRVLLGQFKNDPDRLREPLRAFLRESQADFNQWFAQAGREPLVNLLVFDPEGTLLADSLVNPPSEGKNYAERDYYTGLLRDPDPGAVYVSRVYPSFQDGTYKVAVITRIWDGDRCVGLLAATLPLSSQLVVLDMKDEPAGAGVVCPMDWSYPERHAVPAEQRHEYVYVLHPGYHTPSHEPRWIVGRTRGALLPDVNDTHAADYFTADACFTDYARVGPTHFVVVVRQPYSWPIFFLLGLCAALAVVAAWCVGGRVRRLRAVPRTTV